MQLPKLGVITVFNTQKSQLEEDCLMVPCFGSGVFLISSVETLETILKKVKMDKMVPLWTNLTNHPNDGEIKMGLILKRMLRQQQSCQWSY